MDIGRKNKESFWPSYVDIMTTLFAVMLILFAVSYARFKKKEGELEMLLNDYKDIINIYSIVIMTLHWCNFFLRMRMKKF